MKLYENIIAKKLNLVNINADEFKFISTGLDLLDVILGGGYIRGGFIEIIADAGTGKSTLCVTTTIKLLRENKKANVIYFDLERSTPRARFFALGLDEDDADRLLVVDGYITAESLFETIHEICQERLAAFKLANKVKNKNGKIEVDSDAPLLIIIDSLGALPVYSHKDIDKASDRIPELARVLASYLRQIVPLCGVSDVTLIAINHQKKKVKTDLYSKEIGGIAGYSDLAIDGGTKQIYLTHQLLQLRREGKVSIGGEELTLVRFTTLKSKAIVSGLSFATVFHKTSGFSNLLTNIMFLKDVGYISNAAGYWKLKGEEKGVRFAELFDKIEKDGEYRKKFYELFWEAANKFIIEPNTPERLRHRIKKAEQNLIANMEQVAEQHSIGQVEQTIKDNVDLPETSSTDTDNPIVGDLDNVGTDNPIL